MKKILSILLCLSIFCMPVLAEYDFSDEAQAEFDRQNETQTQRNDFSKRKDRHEVKNDNTSSNQFQETVTQENLNNYEPSPKLYQKQLLYGSVVTVPTGTTFNVTFDAGISSNSLEKNDRLTASLTNDFLYNGKLIAPAKSLVYGTAISAKNAGYAYGGGALEIQFNEILTPDGTLIKISTEKIYMEEKNQRATKMTRDVVVGALGSMLVGAVFTALGGSSNWGRNMAIYGGIGAIGGGIHGTMQHGEDAKILDGTTINVKLSSPLEI